MSPTLDVSKKCLGCEELEMKMGPCFSMCWTLLLEVGDDESIMVKNEVIPFRHRHIKGGISTVFWEIHVLVKYYTNYKPPRSMDRFAV